MVVLNGKGFKLPRLEKEKFVALMRSGLEYDRDQGVFRIKSYDKIEEITDAVSAILGSRVIFLQRCIRCGRDFQCKECKYEEECSTKNLPFSCVCPKCLRDRKHFEEYLETF